jgi:hypothetical protein
VPIADALAKMPRDDVRFVVGECLSVVQRKQAKGWAKVYVNGSMMFQEIEGPEMLKLTQAVCEVSLGRFFPTSQPDSGTPAE